MEIVPGYTRPALPDLTTGRQKISDKERAKRFAVARCLYCRRFNHRAVDCAEREKARSCKQVRADVKDAEEKEDVKEKGKEQVHWGKVTP